MQVSERVTAERLMIGALNRAADEEAHRNGLTRNDSPWFSAGPAADPYGWGCRHGPGRTP